MSSRRFNLFLVRHGEAEALWGGLPDPGLSQLGHAQAARVAAELPGLLDGPIGILSSPLTRARQSAEPLSAALGVEIEVDDAVREIPSPPEVTDRAAWLRQFMRQRWETQPKSLRAWRARAIGRLAELDGCTVVFTHFMVLNAIVTQLLDCHDTVCFAPDNASITQLRRDGDALRIVRLGDQMKSVPT